MFAIDQYPISSPYYHTANDTAANLDLGICAAATKIAGAALVELASP